MGGCLGARTGTRGNRPRSLHCSALLRNPPRRGKRPLARSLLWRHSKALGQPTFLDRYPGKSRRVPLSATRELLVIDLRTYGEDAVAAEVVRANEETLERIFDRADNYLYADEFAKPPGASPFLAEAPRTRGGRGHRRRATAASLEAPQVERDLSRPLKLSLTGRCRTLAHPS